MQVFELGELLSIKKIVSLRKGVAFFMSNSINITEKKYNKLIIQTNLNGFVFCIFDTLNNKVIAIKEINFSTYSTVSKIEDYFWKAFSEHKELSSKYDEILVIHDSNLNTFVPKAMFDEQFLGSYLQYNTKVFETDFFTFDEISNHEMNNVYIPFVNINNYLLDQFESFNYKHSGSVLLEKLFAITKNNDEKQVFVHFTSDRFDLVVIQNQNLILFNSFEYKTPEDFIYYLLFTAEQLQLNPENFKLQLLGSISKEDSYYEIAYKYIRNVSLLDVYEIMKQNDLTTAQNLKHFILLQS
jgi:hypothetical protein